MYCSILRVLCELELDHWNVNVEKLPFLLRQVTFCSLRLAEHILALPVSGLTITTSVLHTAMYCEHLACNMPICRIVPALMPMCCQDSLLLTMMWNWKQVGSRGSRYTELTVKFNSMSRMLHKREKRFEFQLDTYRHIYAATMYGVSSPPCNITFYSKFSF